MMDLINETERQLAAHHCRKQFRDHKNLDALCIVPQRYSIQGKAAWMGEAKKIIDEETGKQQRECAA